MPTSAPTPAPPREPPTSAILQQAVALHRRGMLAEAGELYGRILAIEPTHFDALHLLGVVRHQQDRNAEALELIGAALAIAPRNAAALSNHGIVLTELGRHGEAVVSYDAALAIEPHHAAALNNRGSALRELGRHAEAIASFERAIAIAPDFADAVCNRGTVLHALARLEEAVACFDEALALDPRHAGAHNNRGATLHELGRHEEAIASFNAAIALQPANATLYYHRGRSLRHLQRIDEALASYRRAVALDPNYAAAHWAAGLLALMRGEYAAGWPDYEWRFRHQELALPARDFAQPRWRGDTPLDGRTILLHAEQGLGDTIQFARYAALVAARGAHVVLEVQPALHALLDGMPGVAAVVSRGDPLPNFDLHCPLPSLPLAFATTLATIPAPAPYLWPPAARIAAWKDRLSPGALRVGLAWSGNPSHKNDRNRSMPFAALASLVAMPAVIFISLQKDRREADVLALRDCPNVIDVSADLRDFADTAAVISLLDLVITVDTSVAHLAGALGKPVWILLPVAADWRWLLDREDSPWYPTARLLRQTEAGNWDVVVADVRRRLAGPLR
jgi:tetratricopeptide (TPR) repeat protein